MAEDGVVAGRLGELRRTVPEMKIETEAEFVDAMRRVLSPPPEAYARIIGVNHRDLRTFTIDRELAIRLRPRIPRACVMVAESGIRDRADVERLGRENIDAVLVGETLMRASAPGDSLRALLGNVAG